MTRKLSSASVIWSRCWLQCQFLRELARGFDSLRDLRLGCSCGGMIFATIGGLQLSQLQRNSWAAPGFPFSCGCGLQFCILADCKLATGSRFEVHKRLVVSLLRFEYLDGLMCICCLRASCIPHSWSLTLGLLFRLPRLPLIFVSYWPTAFDHFARANHTSPRPPHPYHQPPRPSHP